MAGKGGRSGDGATRSAATLPMQHHVMSWPIAIGRRCPLKENGRKTKVLAPSGDSRRAQSQLLRPWPLHRERSARPSVWAASSLTTRGGQCATCGMHASRWQCARVVAATENGPFVCLRRNQMLGVQGVAAPRVKKTGTTIVGVVYKVCDRIASARPTAAGHQRCVPQPLQRTLPLLPSLCYACRMA